MIFTDGNIDDIQEVSDQIVRGSELPLSFVFVGLGDGNFEHLKTLDADHIALYSKKLHRSMSRDIV